MVWFYQIRMLCIENFYNLLGFGNPIIKVGFEALVTKKESQVRWKCNNNVNVVYFDWLVSVKCWILMAFDSKPEKWRLSSL